MLGSAYEKSGRLEQAIACFEASITDSDAGSYPFDRLLAIYNKQKRVADELRVAEAAVAAYQKRVTSGCNEQPKLLKYQTRLARLKRQALA